MGMEKAISTTRHEDPEERQQELASKYFFVSFVS
jgi:hypothetical protein